MDEAELKYARSYIAESAEAIEAAAADSDFVTALGAIADAMTTALRGGGKILLCGNGGSAADAQHIAGELISRFEIERTPLAAVALTTDTSVLTAIGNDYGYEQVFERQVNGLGNQGDVLIALSTSGRSKNVLRALDAARARGLVTVGLTGRMGGEMHGRCDVLLQVHSSHTPVIQQLHVVAAHIVCGIVEKRLAAKA
jgi:D-sedoheptulose 7-phosphate isomerase